MGSVNQREFSGIYLSPEGYGGTEQASLQAFAAYLRQITKPVTQEDHLLVREWAMIQWRLQGLQQMELDWWESYERAMDAQMGEGAVGEVDAVTLLQTCNRAIAAFERLVRLEKRFKKRELQLLPLMEGLLSDSGGSGTGVSPVSTSAHTSARESEGLVPQIVSPSQQPCRSLEEKMKKISSVVANQNGSG